MAARFQAVPVEEEPLAPEDRFQVRLMAEQDLPAVIRIDAKHSGRDRTQFLREKFDSCVREPGMNTSLIAQVEGTPVGFMFGKLYFGEFGIPAARAVLDTIGVQTGFGGQGVGHALLNQYRKNLGSLRVKAIDTLVDWERSDLISFFRSVGFRPSRSMDLVWDTKRYHFLGSANGVKIRRATEADLPLINRIGEEASPPQPKYYGAK